MASSATAQTAEQLYVEGVDLWNRGLRQDAIALLDCALRQKPDFPEALCMGGFILREQGKPEPALNFYRRALHLNGDLVIAWSNLGKLLFDLRRYGEALECFERVVALAPNAADGWNNQACALRELGRLAEAETAARRALALSPDFAEAALNLGSALLKLDRVDEALSAYHEAGRLNPQLAAAFCGEALALRALDRLDEARTAFEKAEALRSVEARSGKGCLDLTLGNFADGWEGYEFRWIAGRSLTEALGARFPTWTGRVEPGLRILVMNDHGLGDTIQFFRYLPLMLDAGLAVDFLCPRKLHRLLGADRRLRFTEEIGPATRYDAQIALSSLPRAFETRLDTIPADVPYLVAEAGLKEKWASRIGGRGLKIGVVWQGNPHPEADMARSPPLRNFEPLSRVPGARLISLQKGIGVEQLEDLPADMAVETLGPDFDAGPDAFLDTAAAMFALDLVVTCDTSIAHLAGALGRPVWVALKRDAEWRWLRDRDDFPWYPTMRLFRQDARGDWRSVFEHMSEELRTAWSSRQTRAAVAVPVAVGELIDKITILELKAQRLAGEDQRRNVLRELEALRAIRATHRLDGPELRGLTKRLSAVNAALWDIEDKIRRHEIRADFGDEFIQLARSVYISNDERADITRKINALCKSEIVEEKSYFSCRNYSSTP